MSDRYACNVYSKTLRRPCDRCPNPGACIIPDHLKAASAPVRAEVAAPEGIWTPSVVTIPDIPLVMAGVEYQLSTGPRTFTPEDIQDFVTSQDDPAIVSPRLQIGHSVEDGSGAVVWPPEAWPALGKFINIRFDADLIMAVGDAVGVPQWLAAIMPIAYPNRSIEGHVNAVTNSGHTWGLVVHAVALLGVIWPGVSTLDDLPLLFTEEGPDDIIVVGDDGEEVDVKTATKVAAARRPASAATPVQAAVNVEDVRRAYYDSLNADQMWWWIRAIYIDPNELIVMDDDSGDLFRVPFTINGEEVEFSDPEQVRIQYVDASNGFQATTEQVEGRRVAVFASRAESRPESNTEGGGMTPDQIRALRARLGLTEQQLPDDASAEQINAALGVSAAEETPPAGNPAGGEPAAPSGDGGEEEDGDDDDGEEQPGGDPAGGEPAAAALPEGMIAVPAADWQRVSEQAASGAQVAATAQERSDAEEIRAALSDGKIRPADVPSYRNMQSNAATREIAHRMLTASVEDGGLHPGIVPVSERGELPATGPDGESVDAAGSGYDESWLTPAERGRIGAVKSGEYEPPRVMADGNYNRNGAGAGATA